MTLFSPLADQVAATIDRRIEIKNATRAGDHVQRESAIVVVLGAASRMRSHPSVAKILALGPTVDVYCICLAESDAQLPEECRAVVNFPIGEHNRLELRLSDGSVLSDVAPDQVNPDWAEETARALAPLRLDRQKGSGAGLPDSLVLLDLLGLEPPDGRQRSSRVGKWAGGPRRLLSGLPPAGSLEVDLQHDGPHGLVAGTTGSGKSELLQTLIASLGGGQPPRRAELRARRLQGRAAHFKACARLPHTVGMVTDLDGHLTERALTSLAAQS